MKQESYLEDESKMGTKLRQLFHDMNKITDEIDAIIGMKKKSEYGKITYQSEARDSSIVIDTTKIMGEGNVNPSWAAMVPCQVFSLQRSPTTK